MCPSFGGRINDPGVSLTFTELCRQVIDKLVLDASTWTPEIYTSNKEPLSTATIPGARIRYLAEIAEQGRAANKGVDT